MLQVHRLDGLCHALGFTPIHQLRLAVFDVAEHATARAHVAQHQEGGRAGAPALAQVRAHGFFADRVQFFRAHQRVQLFIRLARWRAHLDPLRAAQRAGIHFFRV